MRNLFTRYIFWELLKVFLVTLTGMTGVIVLFGVGQEAIRQGLGLEPIVRLLPYILPDALRFAVPATVLFAACSVYGRMSATNEVVAVKSLGLSPMVFLWPAIVLSFLLSLLSVWLNDVAVTWGRQGVQRVVVQSVEQIAYGMLRTQRSYSSPRLSINVKEVDGRRLVQPTVFIHSAGESGNVTLTADEAELRSNPDASTLTILLTHGFIEVDDKVRVFFPDTIERVVPLSDFSNKAEAAVGPSHCPLWRIPHDIAQQREQIQRLQQTLAAEAAYDLLSGDFEALGSDAWSRRRQELVEAGYRLHRLRTEPWRRWASGFSCLFFVVIGAPMAIRLKNSDITTSFILCFLPILVVYYPLLAYGLDRAKNGALPPYSVWLGNLICLIAGIWLMRKVIRY